MDGGGWELQSQPGPDSRQDLVPDPGSCGAIYCPRGDQATADGGDDGAAVEERHVVTDFCAGNPGREENDHVRYDERNHVDSRAHCSGSFDGLKINRDKVYIVSKGAEGAQDKPRNRYHRSLAANARWNSRFLAHKELINDKAYQ